MLAVANPDLVSGPWAPALLARAILNSSFKAADSFVDRFPQLWTVVTVIHAHLITPRDDTYFGRRIRDENVVIRRGTAVEWVLYDGSYEQCQHVLKTLQSSRSSEALTYGHLLRHRHRQQKQDPTDDVGPKWRRCLLNSREYHALLAGNIERVRDDREPLWTVISQEVANGHSTSISYLLTAIRYFNVEAVVKMLEAGWKANSNLLSFSKSPMQVATLRLDKPNPGRIGVVSKALIDILERNTGPFFTQNSKHNTHSDVYSRYWNAQRELALQLREKMLQEMVEVLTTHGARTHTSGVSSLIFSKPSAYLLYFAFYAIFLPVLIVYTTQDVWTAMSQGQKFGFMYLWAVVAVLLPPYNFLVDGPPGRQHRPSSKARIWYAACLVPFVVNHFVLPVLVVHYNWQPLINCRALRESGWECTDHTFLLPLVVGAMEYILGSGLYILGHIMYWWR